MRKLLDPVCGMSVDDSALMADGYEDVAFCAPGCRTAFLNDPDSYRDRLDGAEPMRKRCTCGKQADLICRCGESHDDSAEVTLRSGLDESGQGDGHGGHAHGQHYHTHAH